MKTVIRIVGELNEIINFKEIEQLINGFRLKGWNLVFQRNGENTGWSIQWEKEKQ